VTQRALFSLPVAVSCASVLGIDSYADRRPGLPAGQCGWENFVYDPSLFAPMTDMQLKEEGWE
jgi:hypothetical protein